MKTFLIWEEGNPDPYEVEERSAEWAVEKLAEEMWYGCAGECGEEMTFFCEGEVYPVSIEFEPTFSALKWRQREHPGPRPEHDCKRGHDGKVCYPCFDYDRALRDWLKNEERVKAFHEAAKEHAATSVEEVSR